MLAQTVLKLIAVSFVGGILCGASWDLFKIQRIVLKIPEARSKNKVQFVIVFFHDVLFCFACGVLTVLVFYYGNEGNVRFIGLATMALGALIYRKTVGRLVIKSVEKLNGFFSTIFYKFVELMKKVCCIFKKSKKNK